MSLSAAKVRSLEMIVFGSSLRRTNFETCRLISCTQSVALYRFRLLGKLPALRSALFCPAAWRKPPATVQAEFVRNGIENSPRRKPIYSKFKCAWNNRLLFYERIAALLLCVRKQSRAVWTMLYRTMDPQIPAVCTPPICRAHRGRSARSGERRILREIVDEPMIEAPEFEAPACRKCGASDAGFEGVEHDNLWRRE